MTTSSSAVIDLGSNSFRLVVFGIGEGGCWKRTARRCELVGLGGDLGPGGALSSARSLHAIEALRSFVAFCRIAGIPAERIDAVATSAIRDAPDGEAFVARAGAATGLPIRILSEDDEARYAYVAAVNSTTLEDGVVLDLGGGSLELAEVRARHLVATASWPVGAVRTTERFLPGDGPAGPAAIERLREHVVQRLAEAPWAGGHERLVGLGGTVRALASAAIRAAGLPLKSVQGFLLTREALAELVAKLASRPPAERAEVPGIKRGRGEIVLAGAVVLQAVLEAVGAAGIEVAQAGLREGVFLSTQLAPADPPLVPSVRAVSVENVARLHEADIARAQRRVTRVQDVCGEPLLEAAAWLHDVPSASILRAGLPGYSARETALVAAMAAGGVGPLEAFAPILADGDAELVRRGRELLRSSEGEVAA